MFESFYSNLKNENIIYYNIIYMYAHILVPTKVSKFLSLLSVIKKNYFLFIHIKRNVSSVLKPTFLFICINK